VVFYYYTDLRGRQWKV